MPLACCRPQTGTNTSTHWRCLLAEVAGGFVRSRIFAIEQLWGVFGSFCLVNSEPVHWATAAPGGAGRGEGPTHTILCACQQLKSYSHQMFILIILKLLFIILLYVCFMLCLCIMVL